MGRLRLVGSLNLQVSFAKELYKRDDILQKRPIILRHLLMVATPYLIRLVDLHGACIKHSCGTKSLFVLQKPDEIIQFPINDRSAHTQRNKERLEQYGKKECAKPTNSPWSHLKEGNTYHDGKKKSKRYVAHAMGTLWERLVLAYVRLLLNGRGGSIRIVNQLSISK